MLRLCRLAVFAAIFALFCTQARAVDNASPVVGLNLNTLVRITGTADLVLSGYSGSGDLPDDEDLCVWTNDPDGTYTVTATGSGADSAFTVVEKSPGTHIVPYKVYWNTTSGPGTKELFKGVETEVLTGANTQSQTCTLGSSDTANVQVKFKEADLLASPPNGYTGVLTITITSTPE